MKQPTECKTTKPISNLTKCKSYPKCQRTITCPHNYHNKTKQHSSNQPKSKANNLTYKSYHPNSTQASKPSKPPQSTHKTTTNTHKAVKLKPQSKHLPTPYNQVYSKLTVIYNHITLMPKPLLYLHKHTTKPKPTSNRSYHINHKPKKSQTEIPKSNQR